MTYRQQVWKLTLIPVRLGLLLVSQSFSDKTTSERFYETLKGHVMIGRTGLYRVKSYCSCLINSMERSSFSHGKRSFSFSGATSSKMSAWQVQNYGEPMVLNCEAPVPIINKPNEVLVKVSAVSVNPIDTLIEAGYGRVLLGEVRKICGTKASLPLTLGRDFAGEVVGVGSGVQSVRVGDQVYGTVPLQNHGCLADFVVTGSELVAKKPEHLTTEECAGILYAGMTAWSSLKITGDIALLGAKNTKVLVIGGSGGVGIVAIQLLKQWGAHVVTTCATDAVNLVQSVGPDLVIDYKSPDAAREIELAGKYDIILDASGVASPSSFVPCLRSWRNAKFITLRSPLLSNLDKNGVIGGLFQSGIDLLTSNVSTGALANGATVRWGYFLPLGAGVTEISELVSCKKIKPVIDSIFPYEDAYSAFNKLKSGHIRGKVIISKNCSVEPK